MEQTNSSLPARAGAYLRTAASDPDSIEQQLQACRDWAAEHGYDLREEHVYADDGASGVTMDRPAWKRMMQDIHQPGGPPFQLLLMRDGSRITREADPRAYMRHMESLRAAGLRVEFTDSPGSCTDGEAPDDRSADLGSHIASLCDRRDSRAQSALIIRGRLAARQRRAGRYVSAPAPYGFELVPEDESPKGWQSAMRTGNWRLAPATDGSWEAVCLIFARLADGATLRAVAEELNASGAPLPRGAREWRRARVARIASRPIYMGDLVVQRAGAGGGTLTVTGWLSDPPVSRELFARVQARLRRS